MQILGSIINAVWQLLCIPITVDGITFNTWQFTVFVVFVAVSINLIFGNRGQEK